MTQHQTARRALYDALMTDGIAGRGHSPDRSEQATALIDAYRDEARRELLGDDLNPSNLVLDAQAYRHLADGISATMADQNEWDGDEAEDVILLRYVQHLAKRRDEVLTEAAVIVADVRDEQYRSLTFKAERHALNRAHAALLAARTETPQES